MLKLLKNMRRQERLMALACLLLVAGQVYFDLKLPDYMTELTKLIKTAGSTTADITSVGLRMLGCTLASALLAIACGFLAARTASGKAVPPCHGPWHGGDAVALHPQPDHPDDQRYHPDPNDSRPGPADAHQVTDHGGLGCHQNSGQELAALRGDCGVRRRHLRNGTDSHVHLHPPVPAGAEADG